MIDDYEQNRRINPGVSMNRPRYIVEFLFIIIIAVVYKLMMMTDERVIIFTGRTELDVKARDNDNAFSDDTESFKIGVHRTDYVDVPQRSFVGYCFRRLYQYITGHNTEVISVRRETNLVFDERLAHLDKYTEPILPTIMADMIREQIDALVDKAASHPEFSEISSSLSEMIKERRDDDVQASGILISKHLLKEDGDAYAGSVAKTDRIVSNTVVDIESDTNLVSDEEPKSDFADKATSPTERFKTSTHFRKTIKEFRGDDDQMGVT